ncbi:MAG: trypsin-like peptidase domain-containing protein [Vicinamibacteraceae bacterium]|nr:trypsin-like peptidase domain-containing protein [Vicinamibacteraceae bacterium]
MAVWVPSGPQKQRLRQALLAAFDQQELTLLVSDYFAPEAFPAIATEGSLPFRVHTLIEYARMHDWLLDLLAAARERRPRNAALAALADETGLAATGARLDNATGRTLEEIVRTHATFINPAAFRETMAALEGRVCWVDVPGGGGTGFLVGPDLVLTNEHVIRRLTNGLASWRDTACVFDFKEGAGGETVDRKKLTRVALEPQGQWLVSAKPPSAFDEQPDLGDPSPDEVDYAILRLAEKVGELPVGGDTPDVKAEPRGWIPVPSPPPTLQAGQQVFLLQHPKGEPLRLSVGAITTFNAGGTRLRYDANSRDGSSGSPVLDADLRLVALHHARDPKDPPAYNQAIPVSALLPVWQAEHVTLG